MKDYTNSRMKEVIGEYIHSERDRNLLIRRYVDGITYEKLAAYYQIMDHLFGKVPEYSGYSFSSGVREIPYSDSPFSVAVEKKGIENVFPVIDELMETLYVINPPLYDSVMRKIE